MAVPHVVTQLLALFASLCAVFKYDFIKEGSLVGRNLDTRVWILYLLAVSLWQSLNFSESHFPPVESWESDITTFTGLSGRAICHLSFLLGSCNHQGIELHVPLHPLLLMVPLTK